VSTRLDALDYQQIDECIDRALREHDHVPAWQRREALPRAERIRRALERVGYTIAKQPVVPTRGPL
jgi:hypothetical protein